MSEVEKQESQKTVVAFITGLLIGGLIVWVMSPSETAPVIKVEAEKSETGAQTEQNEQRTELSLENKTAMETGDGSLTVSNQSAGKAVMIESMDTPTDNGWVVVRDYLDGVPGNVLGAARYSKTEGLMPKEVPLMRETQAGNMYQVVFFNNMGAPEFSLSEDTMVEGIQTSFAAN